jgi:hypothetical protein
MYWAAVIEAVVIVSMKSSRYGLAVLAPVIRVLFSLPLKVVKPSAAITQRLLQLLGRM